jgi:hypothetical protein
MRRTRSQTSRVKKPFDVKEELLSGSEQLQRAGPRAKKSVTQRGAHKLCLSKPPFISQHTPLKNKTLLDKIELCDSLVTQSINIVNPDLKPYFAKLRKFKVFKSFSIQMKTLKLIQSELGELNQQDQELEQILKEDNNENNRKFYERYGIGYRDDFKASKPLDQIEQLSLNH